MSVIPPESTENQTAVANAPAEARLLVEAGPGTGKTFTLIRRLLHLYKSARLIPATQILVLSFSVSAVRVVRQRIEEAQTSRDLPDDELEFTQIRTFDSYASRLLWEEKGAAFLSGKDYDERIQDAIELIRSSESVRKRLAGLGHVLVDETQDLVGLRADLTLEILKAANSGFTLFADSAQGIFDFQINPDKSSTKSADLLASLRKAFPDLGPALHFDKNWRVGGNETLLGVASRGRALILESVSQAWTFLQEQYAALESKGPAGEPKFSADLMGPHTCVVCRTNADVLKLAGALHRDGVPFQISRRRSEGATAKWVGKLFFACEGNKISKGDFEKLAARRLGLATSSASGLWNELCIAVGKRGSSIDYTSLRAAVDAGAVLFAEDYDEQDHHGIVLSTIHRAKGKEYDNVIVVFEADLDDEKKLDQATRVLFVGLTRAKKRLFKIERGFNMIHTPEGYNRCFRLKPNPKRKGTFFFTGIEVGIAEDLDSSSFASTAVGGSATELKDLQRAIADEIAPGDSCTLKLTRFDEGCPIYRLWIRDRAIAETSTRFGWDLWKGLKYARGGWKPKQFPRTLSDFWVKEAVTVVGDLSRQDVPRPFKNSGLWNGVHVEGIASTSGTKWAGYNDI
jgi:DNA helicase-2/ATP-dependent DNA helicase PcrA